MESANTIKRFIKLGFLPLKETKDGQPKVNLVNTRFVVFNLFRILPYTIYLFFKINDFLNNDLNMKSVIAFSFNVISYIGGSGLAIVLAVTGQRLGPNCMLGKSTPCCWRNLSLNGLIIAIYIFGNILTEVPLLIEQKTLAEIFSLTFALILNYMYVIVDYGVLGIVSFLWVKDLKTKINFKFSESKTSINDFEEILLDFEKLRHAMKLLATFMFPFAQLLAISSSYLGFVAGYNIKH